MSLYSSRTRVATQQEANSLGYGVACEFKINRNAKTYHHVKPHDKNLAVEWYEVRRITGEVVARSAHWGTLKQVFDQQVAHGEGTGYQVECFICFRSGEVVRNTKTEEARDAEEFEFEAGLKRIVEEFQS